MCDTMVALGNSTLDGSVLFAKNSDRQPNECHIIVRVPRRKYPEGARLKCTYIEIEQARETYEVLLLKPFWIWGAEMGCNEFGLNIGNEAVFTKEPYGKNALLGMDMLRIALERCRTSEEAIHLIVDLLDRYGQGGNCGYQKKFTYHNSFLIADKDSAYVLETAGSYWASKKIDDIYAISNRLSIEKDYDIAHKDLVSHAIDKGWCRDETSFSFAKCYSDKLYTHFSGSAQRREACSGTLSTEKGRITVDTLKRILRSHHPEFLRAPFAKSSIKSVCAHAGFIYGDHTTGSYVASIGKDGCTYWVTGSSTPCLAVFKPLWLTDGCPLVFTEDQTRQAVDFWLKREQFYRMAIENRIDLVDYTAERDRLEQELSEKAPLCSSDAEKNELMLYALEKEEDLIEKYSARAADKPGLVKGSLYYRHYWRKQNKSLFDINIL